MDQVNRRLDDLIKEYFHILHEIFKEYKELDLLMKDGYLSIAQARKSMGMNALSASQYNLHSMTANIGILVVKTDERLHFEKYYRYFTVCKQEEKDQIRRRGTQSKHNGLGDSLKEIDIRDEAETVIRSRKKDPITMFGVLVPQSLRRGQDKFKKSINISVSISCLKSKLMQVKEQYIQLAKSKDEMLVHRK